MWGCDGGVAIRVAGVERWLVGSGICDWQLEKNARVARLMRSLSVLEVAEARDRSFSSPGYGLIHATPQVAMGLGWLYAASTRCAEARKKKDAISRFGIDSYQGPVPKLLRCTDERENVDLMAR